MTKEQNLRIEWQFANASVVATGANGFATTRSELNLQIAEGRTKHFYADSTPPTLVYEFSFEEISDIDPESSEQTKASIVLQGELPDGSLCKVWGDGHVGYNNHGKLEGVFSRPPQMELTTDLTDPE